MTAYGTAIFSMSDVNRLTMKSPYFDRPFMFFPRDLIESPRGTFKLTINDK